MVAAVLLWPRNRLLDTPWTACPYVMATLAPVRNNRLGRMPILLNRLNQGTLFFMVLSLCFTTSTFRLAPAPRPTPRALTFLTYLMRIPTSFQNYSIISPNSSVAAVTTDFVPDNTKWLALKPSTMMVMNPPNSSLIQWLGPADSAARSSTKRV